MGVDDYREYCLSKKGVTESFPFGKKPNMLVFKVMGKMFTASDISYFEHIRLKFSPEDVMSVRERYPEVSKPAYVSPRQWNRIYMHGNLSESQIRKWIDNSYELVKSGLSGRQREELEKM